MKLSRDKMWNTSKDYFFITLGTAIYAFGFASFILPHDIVIGGVAGVSTLLYFTLGIPIAIGNYSLNLILLAIAYKVLGKNFVLGTIFGATMISIMLGIAIPLCGDIFHLDPFLSCVIGGITSGVGIGMAFTHGGSTGGTDIVAAMVSKYSNIQFGRMMIYVDMCIISSSYFIFHQVDNVIYGFTVLFMSSYMADMLINTTRQSVQFTIFSSKWQQIADAINNEVHRGCTVVEGTGWFTKKPVKMLLVMCRKIESMNIFRVIKEIDPDAIVTQANVSAVYGKGFDTLRVKTKSEEKNKMPIAERIAAATRSDMGAHHSASEQQKHTSPQHSRVSHIPADYSERTTIKHRENLPEEEKHNSRSLRM